MAKCLRKIGIALLIFLNLSLGAWAANTDTENLDAFIDGDLSLARCIAKGNIDFPLFLNASIWADGFVEGILEPYRDAFGRNQCQANDVFSLIRQRDDLRRYIRDAFLTCNTQKLPDLEQAYHEVTAEIYYVRHVVDGGLALNLPYDALSTQRLQDEDSFYVSDSQLKAEMRSRYVGSNKFFSSEDFDLLYNKLTFKYRERKKSYVDCENSSWKSVEEKWDEFIETAGGIVPAWEDLEKGVGGRAEKIVEASTDMTYGGYLDSIFMLRVNSLPPREGFGEIYDALVGTLPEGYTPTQRSFLNAVQNSEAYFVKLKTREELAAEFEVLYKDTGDSTVESFMEELKNLNEVLEDSFDPLDEMLSCTKTMNERQCSSSI